MKYPADPAVKLDPGTGKFTDGNPSLGVPASIDRAAEQNAIFDEIIEVITNAGLTPNEGDLTQLRQAIEVRITAHIDALVAASPGSLDTLNELAAALGDDPNFATAMTNLISTKLNSSSYTAADVLAKIKTVDGAASGLDADLLQGENGSLFFRKKNDIPPSIDLNTYATTGWYHQNSNASAVSGSNYPVGAAGLLEVYQDGSMTYQRYTIYNTGNSYSRARYINAWSNWRQIWNSENLSAADLLAMIKNVDGTSSGLDADLLDGQSQAYYRNAGNLNAGTLPSTRLPSASTGARGGVELATNTEAAALTDTTRAITPGNLGSIFARLTSANGYLKLAGGLILQWGRYSVSSNTVNQSKTFPTSFPNACLQFVASEELSSASFNDNCSIGTIAPSTTTFYLTNGRSGTNYFRMIAIGY